MKKMSAILGLIIIISILLVGSITTAVLPAVAASYPWDTSGFGLGFVAFKRTCPVTIGHRCDLYGSGNQFARVFVVGDVPGGSIKRVVSAEDQSRSP